MKKFFALSIAAASMLMVAAPATAGVIDINLSGMSSNQVQNGNVAQQALSAALVFGPTGTGVDISSTAVAANQLATADIDVVQNASLLDLNALTHTTNQTVNGAVNQSSASLAASGSLGSNSAMSSVGATVNQSATTTIRIRQ